MLKENTPLKQIWVDEVVKRTGMSREGVGDNLNKSKEYNKIKDKGADYIKQIGGKKLPRDFDIFSSSRSPRSRYWLPADATLFSRITRPHRSGNILQRKARSTKLG